MSRLTNFRTSLACALICSLIVTGLLTLTTGQSDASNNSLPRSFTPSANEPSEESAPPDETVDEATRSRVSETLGKLPLSFEENRGQVDGEVKYISRGSGYTLFLTPTEAVLALRRSDGKRAKTAAVDALRSRVPAQSRPTRASVLRMKLSGANPSPAITGESGAGVKNNYFIGNEPAKWQTDVARYERVRYGQVYPGIDMIYYGRQQQLEYDFEVAPGADTSRIALEFTGIKRVKIEGKTGELVLKTAGGEVRQRKPVAYQEEGRERREVASRYVVKGKRRVGIELGEYDLSKRLVIDPVLSYSTYLGGSDRDYGSAIAVDSSGIAYVTGSTSSPDFPILNQYQTYQTDSNAFVIKLDTNAVGAASLLYSTYLGGSGYDEGAGIAIDASGHAYVTGFTGSTDFPLLNQYQTYQGGGDAYVTKLDTNVAGAASLLYSTYLGGKGVDPHGGTDFAKGIAVDISGIAYVKGYTDSYDFPLLNQYQAYQGGGDVFVTKLDTNAVGAASLLYSTCLGGTSTDLGYHHGIAIDSSGHAYVTGDTYSTDFPLLNHYQTYQGGGDYGGDTFVTKLDTTAAGAASLLYSTYLGGSFDDYSNGIAADESGHAYVTGFTDSKDFPLLNQYQTDQIDFDAYVTKLDTTAAGAASLLYSTYLGGGGFDSGNDIAIDASGNVYVTGDTGSTDFPTLNPYQVRDGSFVTKLDMNASGSDSLLYSTYLTGNGGVTCYGIAVDSSGHAYVTGSTRSPDATTFHPDILVAKLTDTTMISGRVTSDGTTGIGGVTVTLSGDQNSTAVTDATGKYSFLNLPMKGDYTVTPSRSALTFIPSQRGFTDLHTNQTHTNFKTPPVTISGKVTTGTATGAAFAGVSIILKGRGGFHRTITTSSDGTYSFSDVPVPNNYRVTAWKTNYAFQPSHVFWFDLTTDQTNRNFIATLKTYTVSGVVKLGTARLAGVTVKLTSPTPAGFPARTATTDSDGAYAFTGVPAGRNYTVTAQKTGYQFVPESKLLSNLSDHGTAYFQVKVYSITGRITRANTTTGIGAVTVTVRSPTPAGFMALTKQTNSVGYYSFWMSLAAGRNYTIKPTKNGFTFSPQTRQITNLSGNIGAGAATNFTGTGP